MRHYTSPRVLDYGTLEQLTAEMYPLLGAMAAADMSFSGAHQPGGGGETTVVGTGSSQVQQAAQSGDGAPSGDGAAPSGDGGAPTSGTEGVGDSGGSEPGADGDGGDAGGGAPAGGGSADGGGNLPFTGFAAGALGLLGGGMALAGRALRRATMRP